MAITRIVPLSRRQHEQVCAPITGTGRSEPGRYASHTTNTNFTKQSVRAGTHLPRNSSCVFGNSITRKMAKRDGDSEATRLYDRNQEW